MVVYVPWIAAPSAQVSNVRSEKMEQHEVLSISIKAARPTELFYVFLWNLKYWKYPSRR